MSLFRPKAAVLWTGGKDCALALHEAKKTVNVSYLVTFAPKDKAFQAHPIEIMKKQAQALGIPHLVLTLTEPYEEAYKKAFEDLRSHYGIETVITGDIDRVMGYENWVRACAEPLGFTVLTPLWQKSREHLLEKYWNLGFEAVITYVNPPLSSEWIGSSITKETIQKLKKIQGVDLCGENGEFHTMVTYGPGFSEKVVYSKSNT